MTTYVIYNEEEEVVDILPFNSDEELDSYKKMNPTFNLYPANDLAERFILEDDAEDNFYED